METNEIISYPSFSEFVQNGNFKFEVKAVADEKGDFKDTIVFDTETDELIAKGEYNRLMFDSDILVLLHEILFYSDNMDGKRVFDVFDISTSLNLIFFESCKKLGVTYSMNAKTDTAGLVMLLLEKPTPPTAKRLAQFLIINSKALREQLKKEYNIDCEKALEALED